MGGKRYRSWLRVLCTVMLALVVTLCYSVTPLAGVYAAEEGTTAPESFTLTSTAKTVDVKGKVTVSVASVSPEGASTDVTFKTSNKKIATVSAKGVVTGKKKGTVTITAVSKSAPSVKKTIKLKVKNIKVSKLKMSKTASVGIGEKVTLKATAAPTGVYAPVKWKTSNKKIATVSSKGVVTGKKKGTVTITAYTTKKTAGKAVKVTCKVTVGAKKVIEQDATLGETKARVMTTEIDMSQYAKGKVVKVWVPVPQSDKYQTIGDVAFSAPAATNPRITTEKTNGNQMLYLEWGADVAPENRTATLTYYAERAKVSRANLKENNNAAVSAEAKAYINKESEYVKINDPDHIVKDTAAMIVKGKTGTLAKTKAIYDWVIANLERIDNGETLVGPVKSDGTTDKKTFKVDGCGYGDTVQILTDLQTFGRAGGHCTDINSTFVALCRAAGIPAREMFGIRMNDDATGGQHCWAEFYLPGTGWVYADPGDVLKAAKTGTGMTMEQVADARKDKEVVAKAAELWGGVDNNRIVLSTGRDITFSPAQSWGTCNTFGYPAAEVDGKRLASFADAANFKYTIKCTEDSAATITAEALKGTLESGEYNGAPIKILDVRGADDYAKAHIPGAVSADVSGAVKEGGDKNAAEANVKAAINGDADNTQYALICYSGNAYANAAAKILMNSGVKGKRVLILAQDDGTQGANGGMKAWNAKYANYVFSEEAYADGQPVRHNITADNLEKILDDDSFVILDVRAQADYEDNGHIRGAFLTTCPGTGVDEAATKAVTTVVNANGKDKYYVAACYTGRKCADTAYTILNDLGVPESHIVRLKGGMSDSGWGSKSVCKIDRVETADASGYTVLDVRKADDYKTAHIPGAVSTPVLTGDIKTDTANLKAALKDGADYLIVCYSGNAYARQAAAILEKLGVSADKIHVLKGGSNEWKGATEASGSASAPASQVLTDEESVDEAIDNEVVDEVEAAPADEIEEVEVTEAAEIEE